MYMLIECDFLINEHMDTGNEKRIKCRFKDFEIQRFLS